MAGWLTRKRTRDLLTLTELLNQLNFAIYLISAIPDAKRCSDGTMPTVPCNNGTCDVGYSCYHGWCCEKLVADQREKSNI